MSLITTIAGMFIQLGNMVFNAAFTPSSWGVNGDDISYAEHALINSKPRLQKTGYTLMEHALQLHLRVEYCKPAQVIQQLKESKDAGEILPLIGANGRYWGDYVITSMPYTINRMFSDSTIQDVTVSLNIKEYVAFSKLEIQQQQARKRAFAVGIQKPVVTRSPQPIDVYGQIAKQLSGSVIQINNINNNVSTYKNNVSKQAKLVKDMQDAAIKARNYLNNAEDQIQQVDKIKAKATGAIAAIIVTKNNIENVVKNLPPTSLNALLDANSNLQAATNAMSTASANIFIPVAIRRDNNSKNG